MRHVFTDKKVLTNIVLLLVAILSASGVNLGLDPVNVQSFVAIIATALNGGLHASAVSGG